MSEALPTVSHGVEIEPGIWRWAVHSPYHRVELASHMVWDGTHCVVFDPLPLADALWSCWPAPVPPDFLVVTNENHVRAVEGWSLRFPGARRIGFQAKAFDRPGKGNSTGEISTIPGWRAIPLPGGAGDETAYHCRSLDLLVFGDAVVHLQERGLEILPAKYCQNPERLRESLRSLPPFGRALFAHGEPLWQHAGDAVERLGGG
jgi:hypothetical protein